MGLPISDTAMAIFRRWVRNLPMSAADRRHVHHLLMGLGLGQRTAAAVLYFFTAGLCGIVLLGVASNNEVLALILGASGCLAFLLILTSRRDELASLWGDLKARSTRKRYERVAAEVTWETIQKIELSDGPTPVWHHLLAAVKVLGGDALSLRCHRDGRPVLDYEHTPTEAQDLSAPSATFRLPSGPDLLLTVTLRQAEGNAVPADIAFRALQRLALAASQRLEHLFETERAAWAESGPPEVVPALATVPKIEASVSAPSWAPIGWLRGALGLGAAAVGHFGDK
jgi:UDP-GlcNAc:undecaprenyl-phosphate GlcNAc-1-phosphate transferase